MRNSQIQRTLLATAAVLALLAVGASAAQAAASITLKCTAAPRNEDSDGTKLCAANPGKAAKIAGVVRNDAGQPVAGKVSLAFSTWTPSPGGGYSIKLITTKEITADAAGQFTISSNPKGRDQIKATLVADPALGISTAPTAQADVQRRLVVKVAKLGGGVVQLTVKGTSIRPLKASITDPSGYYVPGIPKTKKVDAQGKVTFNLGSQTGKFGYYIEAGVYSDLFWPQTRGVKFRL